MCTRRRTGHWLATSSTSSASRSLTRTTRTASSATSTSSPTRACRRWTSRRSVPTGTRTPTPVSYTHLRAHETPEHLVCRLLLEKKKTKQKQHINKLLEIDKIKNKEQSTHTK